MPLAGQYKNYGAAMLPKWAINHGTTHFNVEPGLEEIRQAMYTAALTIAPHNSELIEELRHYHRDENYKIVKQRDDMVSALRYAVMMRRSGKPRDECDGVGFGSMPFAGQRADRSRDAQLARGLDFDLWTGR